MAADLTPATAGGDDTMARSLRAVYHTPEALDDFLGDHLRQMQQSTIPAIRRAGEILSESLKGYGIGYRGPAGLLAAGQIILGNPLNGTLVPLAPIFASNPMAITCAALGAVYYGYQALTDEEKDKLVTLVGKGLGLGFQLLRDMLQFAINKFAVLLNSEEMAEIKRWVRDAAVTFGRHLGDITRAVSDRITDGFSIAAEGTKYVAQIGADLAVSGAEAVRHGSSVVADTATNSASSAYETISGVATRLWNRNIKEHGNPDAPKVG